MCLIRIEYSPTPQIEGPLIALNCSPVEPNGSHDRLIADGHKSTLPCATKNHHIGENTIPQQHFGEIRCVKQTEPILEARFELQLKAFAATVRGVAPFPSTTADAVSNMAVIDAIYVAAQIGSRPSRTRID